jgi:hypothetical protein
MITSTQISAIVVTLTILINIGMAYSGVTSTLECTIRGGAIHAAKATEQIAGIWATKLQESIEQIPPETYPLIGK